MSRRTTILVIALVAQFLLVGVAVAGQLSARVTGEEVRLRVGPVDPIEPFRGAYVDLRYPDLEPEVDEQTGEPIGVTGERGDLYVTLRRDGDVWVASGWSRSRPDDGPYLACDDRDWRVSCGIESLFLPEAEAARVQRDIDQSGLWDEARIDEDGNEVPEPRDSGYVAVVKVDRWGNAAITGLEKH